MAQAHAPLRVHIAPVGYEVRRVTEPLVRLRADRVYLVTFKPNDSAAKYFGQIHSVLRKEYPTIEVRDRFVDLWDMHELLSLYGSVTKAEREAGNLLYVNVSSGTKITAMVGLLSGMFWAAIPYYARSTPTKETEAVHDAVFPPVLRFNVIPAQPRRLLLDIRAAGRPVSKEDLIQTLRTSGLLPEHGRLSTPAVYRRLDSLIDPLIEQGFVETTGRRRSLRIQLTDEGRTACLFLEHV